MQFMIQGNILNTIFYVTTLVLAIVLEGKNKTFGWILTWFGQSSVDG